MDKRELKHHPGQWMRADAAIQLDKFEDDNGIISVNRAGVTVAEQQAVIDRWNRGGAANRPPNLYEPKQPPEDSEHVQGIAVDTSHITKMLRLAAPYGYYQRYAWDKPHFEFDPSRVRIRPIVESMKEFGMIEQLIGVNNKVYALGFGKIKHLNGTEQLTDVKNTTGLTEQWLTDNRRVEAFTNLLDYYAIEPGTVNDKGLVRDPFTGEYVDGGAWSEERATRAEIRNLAKRIK